MKRIILDKDCKNSFMEYAMNRVSRHWNISKLSAYFTYDNTSKLYEYFATGTTYCNNKGEFWLKGSKTVSAATSITFTQDNDIYKEGQTITSPKLIQEYENRCFEKDFYSFREENLFHNVWCEIERILRVNYEGWNLQKETEIFNKYCKQV